MVHKNIVNCLIIVLLLFLCTTVVVPAVGNDSSVENYDIANYWNGNLTVDDVWGWKGHFSPKVSSVSVTYYDKYMKYLGTEMISPSAISGNKHICLSARVSLYPGSTLHEHVARYNTAQLMNHEVCLGTAVTDGHYVACGPDSTEVHWMDNKVGSYTTSLKGGECYGKQTQIVTIGKR